MKQLLLALTVAALLYPAVATAQQSGKKLSQVTFASADESRDGVLSFDEVTGMSQNIRLSMDTNDDGEIVREEFMEWDFGYSYLAQQDDNSEAYVAVKRVLFALSDLDGNGMISAKEERVNTFLRFNRADLNGDKALSEAEFLSAWMPLVILKAGRGG